MSLSTYFDLLAAIKRWPDLETEADLEAIAPDIVVLAEARLNRDLNLAGMLATLEVSEASEVAMYPLPEDCLRVDLVRGPSGETLEPRPTDEFFRWGYKNYYPRFYAIDGRVLRFSPAIKIFSVQYYRRIDPLAEVNTNWLLRNSPDLYLYACLVEVARFSKEPEQEHSRYQQAYDRALGSVVAEDRRLRHPLSQPLRAMIGRQGRKEFTGT